MEISNDFVHAALLQHNYFPAQRRKREELPPIFSSSSFTPTVAEQLVSVKSASGVKGFDVVDYRTTKFNNVSRSLSIPHPVGYSQLVHCMVDHWQDIAPFLDSDISKIKPQQHSDGRLIVMDYESFASRTRRARRQAFGQRYTVHTDVASCFPSIYTHAIPWAVVGLASAKAKTSGDWHNDLDKYARRITRDETQGVPVGPATSNVIAELILGRVDDALKERFKLDADEPRLSRFIDDYTFYCSSHDNAQAFLLCLEEELAKFKLRLNPRKTFIEDGTTPFADHWAIELAVRVPKADKVDVYQAITYLEYAAGLAKLFPDGSVHKYAANSVLSLSLSETAKFAVLDYLLVLAFQQPVLLPVIQSLISETTTESGLIRHPERYVAILKQCAVMRQSDGMTWSLYYITKYKLALPEEVARQVLNTEDCLAMLMIYLHAEHKKLVVTWAQSLDNSDKYRLDRYWLLLYHLFLDGHVTSDACSTPTAFEHMKSSNVNFVDLSK